MPRIALLALVPILLSSCLSPDGEDWKRRWSEDTTAMAGELKLAAQRIVDLAYDNAKLEKENAALKHEIMELKKASSGVK